MLWLLQSRVPGFRRIRVSSGGWTLFFLAFSCLGSEAVDRKLSSPNPAFGFWQLADASMLRQAASAFVVEVGPCKRGGLGQAALAWPETCVDGSLANTLQNFGSKVQNLDLQWLTVCLCLFNESLIRVVAQVGANAWGPFPWRCVLAEGEWLQR